MKKALIIEDEKHIVELLTIHLKDLHLDVTSATNGLDGLQEALTNQYSVILLDVMMPGKDGIEVCRALRGANVHTPVLMLTAKSEEFDKVLGLEIGADDYLTKPFSVRELIARVKSLLRRYDQYQQRKPDHSEIRINELLINGEKRKVTLNNALLDLTPKEFDLLFLLASNPGKSYSREELLKQVWSYDFKGYEHTVNSHVNRLRAKIEKDPNNPDFIRTVWGIGYAFKD
ncbi:MAG: DNA-binding response regulator [Flavobacteriales bacterium]|nr:DNA-binding response regulator [Flavobacteriales bacterium]|tara:strand:+ start:3123 stop:3812 length:690 start_codon:yes stop_codon:yes gene_type:complete